jgi:outer membrane protein OmpA-like peptidoglycan-associated protein
MLGAGSGAVTGFQMGSVGSGQGAMIGAAFGAVYGMISGLGLDLLEEDQLRREFEEQQLREMAWTQEVLAEHYARRLELHPGRDIFPADIFFAADESKLRDDGLLLVEHLAQLNKYRMPWSRVLVTAYMKSSDLDSRYANYVSKKRAQQIATEFIRQGVEPRRVLTKAVTIPNPLVIDPDDAPGRYNQALELVTLDK